MSAGTFAELQAAVERERRIGARADRAFARLMEGKVKSNSYALEMARAYEEAAADLDRTEYAVGVDRYHDRASWAA